MMFDEEGEVRKSTWRLRMRISRSLMMVGRVSRDGETKVHSLRAERHSWPFLLQRGMPLQTVWVLVVEFTESERERSEAAHR